MPTSCIMESIFSNKSGITYEVNSSKITRKAKVIWKLEEITEEVKKYLKIMDNDNLTYQNPWAVTKYILRNECIALNAHIRKGNRLKIHDLSFHCMK